MLRSRGKYRTVQGMRRWTIWGPGDWSVHSASPGKCGVGGMGLGVETSNFRPWAPETRPLVQLAVPFIKCAVMRAEALKMDCAEAVQHLWPACRVLNCWQAPEVLLYQQH